MRFQTVLFTLLFSISGHAINPAIVLDKAKSSIFKTEADPIKDALKQSLRNSLTPAFAEGITPKSIKLYFHHLGVNEKEILVQLLDNKSFSLERFAGNLGAFASPYSMNLFYNKLSRYNLKDFFKYIANADFSYHMLDPERMDKQILEDFVKAFEELSTNKLKVEMSATLTSIMNLKISLMLQKLLKNEASAHESMVFYAQLVKAYTSDSLGIIDSEVLLMVRSFVEVELRIVPELIPIREKSLRKAISDLDHLDILINFVSFKSYTDQMQTRMGMSAVYALDKGNKILDDSIKFSKIKADRVDRASGVTLGEIHNTKRLQAEIVLNSFEVFEEIAATGSISEMYQALEYIAIMGQKKLMFDELAATTYGKILQVLQSRACRENINCINELIEFVDIPELEKLSKIANKELKAKTNQ